MRSTRPAIGLLYGTGIPGIGPLISTAMVAAIGSGEAFERDRHRGVVDEVERAKNRTKSKVRAKVEHPIGIIKRVFGFAKVRYRGLKKNAHRLLVACALANLFIARRHLLRCDVV
jgi:hypothetical protein